MRFWIVYIKRYLQSLWGALASRRRVSYLRRVHGAKISRRAYLKGKSIFTAAGGLSFEEYVDVEPRCEFIGKVTLEKFVRVGRDCRFMSLTHEYDKPTAIPFGTDSFDKGIRVEESAWIGASVTVLSGVTIGRGAIVAAGSVVTQSIPPYMIALGNPARVIYRRNVEEFERLRNEGKHYVFLSPKPLINPARLWNLMRRIRHALAAQGEFFWEPGAGSNSSHPREVPFAMQQCVSRQKGLIFANYGSGYIVLPAGSVQRKMEELQQGSREYMDLKLVLKRTAGSGS